MIYFIVIPDMVAAAYIHLISQLHMYASHCDSHEASARIGTVAVGECCFPNLYSVLHHHIFRPPLHFVHKLVAT